MLASLLLQLLLQLARRTADKPKMAKAQERPGGTPKLTKLGRRCPRRAAVNVRGGGVAKVPENQRSSTNGRRRPKKPRQAC